jgi:hypothetical protein
MNHKALGWLIQQAKPGAATGNPRRGRFLGFTPSSACNIWQAGAEKTLLKSGSHRFAAQYAIMPLPRLLRLPSEPNEHCCFKAIDNNNRPLSVAQRMFKSLYSQTFVGNAGSTVLLDEANSPYALAVLPSYPVFDDCAIDTEKNGINLPMTEGLSQTFQVNVDSTGDRFHFTSHKSFTESGIVEGSPVSFNFDAVFSSEAKVIQAGVVYFVHRVDIASSPPLFSVSHSRGASAPIAFKKIVHKGQKSAADDASKAEATFHVIDEGTPLSFGFDINSAGEVLEAGGKLYAKDVDIKISTRTVFFRVSLKPGPRHKPISITNFGETANRRVQLRIRHKSIRVLQREQKPGKVIARAADLGSATVLDVSPRSFDSVTPEMMQVICVHDIDRYLLHALSNFASACKFFDFSSRSTCSEFQNRALQEARRHMEQFGMTCQRDIGALEVLEYAAHRLLSLSAHLNSQAESKRKEDDKKLKKV